MEPKIIREKDMEDNRIEIVRKIIHYVTVDEMEKAKFLRELLPLI